MRQRYYGARNMSSEIAFIKASNATQQYLEYLYSPGARICTERIVAGGCSYVANGQRTAANGENYQRKLT